MVEVMRFEGNDGSFMLVDATSLPSAFKHISFGSGASKGAELADTDSGPVATAATKLEDSLGSVQGAAVALMETVNEMRKRADAITLDEVSLELALAFSVEGGIIVAKGTAKAEASVTLTWRAHQRPGDAPAAARPAQQ